MRFTFRGLDRRILSEQVISGGAYRIYSLECISYTLYPGFERVDYKVEPAPPSLVFGALLG